MRADQLKRLEDIAERATDIFLIEADPTNWTGDGLNPSELEKDERGNRLWDKRSACQTAVLVQHAIGLIAWGKTNQVNNAALQAMRDADLDTRIKAAEQRAMLAVDNAIERAKSRMGVK